MDKLAHIPGSYGLPVIGSSIDYLLKDRRAVSEENRQKYGDIYRISVFGNKLVVMTSPEANKLVLTNKGDIFSSHLGWKLNFGDIADGTLLATDGDLHKKNRAEVSKAFTPTMRAHYQSLVNDYLKVKDIPEQVAFHELVNTMVVDMLHRIALGGDISISDRKNAIDVIESAAALIKVAFPGSKYQKGLKAKEKLKNSVRKSIDEGKLSAYSHLLRESGLDEKTIFDECVFMLIAGAPTTTAATTFTMHFLLENDKWLNKVIAEIDGLDEEDPSLDDLKSLTQLDLVFKESIRLFPPLHTIPRVCTESFSFKGHEFPENTIVAIVPDATCRSSKVWYEPDVFKPERFSEPLNDAQKWAYIPFGGGAHRCIGALLGEYLAKSICYHLLKRYSIHKQLQNEGMLYVPVPKPEKGLPVRIAPR